MTEQERQARIANKKCVECKLRKLYKEWFTQKDAKDFVTAFLDWEEEQEKERAND